MQVIRPIAAIAAALVVAAPAAAQDALLQRLIADSARVPATGFAFERTVSALNDGQKIVAVHRYDPAAPARWTLVSVNGKPPTAKEAESFAKDAASGPTPSYHRVGRILASGAKRVPGTDCYRVTKLPADLFTGVVRNYVDKLYMDACVGGTPDNPLVTETRVRTVAPFRVALVGKIDLFEGMTRYVPGPDGRPRLREQTQNIRGSALGSSLDTDAAITYRDLPVAASSSQ